jgi:colicin import membrane protein
MGEPILLPKFELPGEKTHWAVRLAVISGIVLLVAVVGLGAVIMHRHKLEVEAHVAREEAIARVKAEAEAKVAAAVAVAKAQREAELAEKRAAAERAAAALAAKQAAKDAAKAAAAEALAEAGKGKAGGARFHRGHYAHGAKGTKLASTTLMKGGGGSGADSTGGMKDLSTGGKANKSGKPDPIDELMKKMK